MEDSKVETKRTEPGKVEVKKRRLRIGTVLVAVLLIVYIPSLVFWIRGGDIRTDMLQMGTIEESINTDACIVRNEQVITSTIEGKYIRRVNEGEKVPVGFGIVTVLKDSSINMLDKLNGLDAEIINIQKEKSGNNTLFSSDVAKLEDEINAKVVLLIEESNQNRLDNTRHLKEQINELIQKKATIIGGNSSADTYLNTLRSERNNIQEQINSGTREVTSECPGTVSYAVDGYENTLNPEAIKSMTPQFLNEIKAGNAKPAGSTVIKSGEPFAKLIKDFEYYLVLSLDETAASSLEPGTSAEIRINDVNEIMDCTVSYRSEVMDGKRVVALRSNVGLSETTALRKVNIDLIKKYSSGLKVPLKSLKDIDTASGMAKIVMSEANYTKFRDVVMKAQNNEFAIIDNPQGTYGRGVSLYDTYVIDPQNIQEGQMIEK